MKAFYHLLRRELIDQRFSFAIAFALGLLPYFVAPVLAASDPAETASFRAVVSRVLIVGFFFGVPLALGLRWLLQGFLAGRRSFELARPVTALQLCGSKLAAGVAIWLGGTLLLGLPTLFSGLRLDPQVSFLSQLPSDFPGPADFELYKALLSEEPSSMILTSVSSSSFFAIAWLLTLPALLAGVALFTLGQALSLMLTHRSWRSLADLFSWAVFIALVGLALRRLALYEAYPWWSSSSPLMPALLLAFCGLAFASAWRSWRAGSLLEAAHVEHSKVMNPGLLLIGACLAWSAHAATQPDVGRLSFFSLAQPSADGSRWILAGPQGEGSFAPVFLVDPATRRADYLLPYPALQHLPRLAADGRRVLTWQKTMENSDSLLLNDFSDSEKTTTALPFRVDPRGFELWNELDESGEILVSFEPKAGVIARHLPEGKEIASADDEALHTGYVQLLHRQGSRFDVLVFRQTLERSKTNERLAFEIRRFQFDTLTARLEPAETWQYEGQEAPQGLNDKSWWYEALPLLEGGIPFARLASKPHLVALSGRRVALPTSPVHKSQPPTKTWSILDSDGLPLASFPLPARAFAVGEIRPGLLLVVVPPQDLRHRFNRLEGNPLLNVFYRWQTLVVDAASGKILRGLEGFVPMKHPLSGRQVWLINQNGEPFDLGSAEAEPTPILPWRASLSGD